MSGLRFAVDFSVYRIELRCVSKRLYMCIETTSICIETTGYRVRVVSAQWPPMNVGQVQIQPSAICGG